MESLFTHLIFQELWLSDVLKEALWNVEKLMSFVGVDQAPVEPSDADTCGINRYSDIFKLAQKLAQSFVRIPVTDT